MTLAMLSWGAHRTLINTLESYQTFGISDSENIIWFQEIDNTDKRIADKYGFKYYGSKDNIGIAEAYKNLVNLATGDTFLFLENDWMALESGDRLKYGHELLYSGSADVVRFRHRRFPGEPLWTLQYKGIEHEKPSHLLDCVHWHTNPDDLFPDDIQKADNSFYLASSKNANWTNNPTMFLTEFLKYTILPKMGSRDVEIDIQEWWEHQDFTVAQDNVGIFTHKRIG
jgi:hypothetical protein